MEEREWVQQIGHRDVPGRPALFGTTQEFLEYFNMSSLRELPELMDKRELREIAKEMNLTLPMDGVQGEEDAAADQAQKNSAARISTADEEASAEIIELRPEQPPADDSPELPGEASELADAGFAQDEELIEQLEPSHTDANDVDVVDSKAADSQDKVSEDE